MTKHEAAEYRAKIGNDFGNIRGKIPSPIVQGLGARAGDYIVFKVDIAGNVIASLKRSTGSLKQKPEKAKKKGR